MEINQNTLTGIIIGPLVDPVSALPVNNFTLTGADSAKIVKHGTTGTEYSIESFTLSQLVASGFYRIQMRATTVDTLGLFMLQITDDSLILPYAHQYQVVHSGYYDMKYGSTNLNCSVQAMANDVITSATIAAGAIDKDDQLIGLNDVPAASMWNESARTLTAFGFENTVSAINNNVITAAAINADAITGDKIAAGAIAKGDQLTGLNDITTGDVKTQADTALTDIFLDHLLAVSAANADIVSGSVIGFMAAVSGDWADFDHTTDSLEAIRNNQSDSFNAASIWNESSRTLTAFTHDVNVSGIDANVITATVIAGDAITSAKIAAGAIDKDDQLIGLNDLTAAQVNAEVDTALSNIFLDRLLAISAANADVVSGSVLGFMAAVSGDWADFDHSSHSLEAIAGAGGGGGASKDQVSAAFASAARDILLHELVASAASDAIDDSFISLMAASDGDWSGFDNTTDSLEAIRDNQGGGGLTAAINPTPMVPYSVDFAETATYRLGLMLTDMIDDLPTEAEITPGQCSVSRKASGGTGWTLVTSQACTESAGTVYFDEAFDSGSGYAQGDSLRIGFHNQSISIGGNTFEITDATGKFFYTHIREDMRGTDAALTSANASAVMSLVAVSAMRQLLLHELLTSAASDATDDSFVAHLAAVDGNWSDFDDTTDSLEALRGRGDAAWITNTITIADISTAMASAMRDNRLHQLITASAALSHVTTDSIVGLLAGSGGTFSFYASDTDSLESIRNRGDDAWVAAGSMADVRSTVSAGVASALRDVLLHELLASAASDATDDSFIAQMATSNGNWSDFVTTTDSLEVIAGTAATPTTTITSAVWGYTDGGGRVLTGNDNFNDPTASAIASQCWSYPIRVITADTNINYPSASTVASQAWAYPQVSPGAGTMGEQVFTDLDAILVDTSTGVAVADGAIADTTFANNAVNASALDTDAVNEIVDGVWAKVLESEGSYTAQQIAQVMFCVLAGVTATSGATLKTPNGVVTRVTATINSDDERTAMTLNV